ncbi:MAG: tRNA (adenosine(37)-N6)-dimethylallyltransferase MiaA [Pseudomonadota bacterium]
MNAVAPPILLAGPTASGKSALALALAEALGGAVINADSQQVYADWRVLSARPSAAEEARAPHRLYGHLPLDAPYSVGRWLRELAPVLAACRSDGLRPIITGGTGLSFRALTEGLHDIPESPPEIRSACEAALAREGVARFAETLAARDPATAAEIDLANPARLLRAAEVLEATGRGLAAWRATRPEPLLPRNDTIRLALRPEREALYARCDRRFDTMIAEGALEEVASVLARGLPPSLPGMKALGARELTAHLEGRTSLAEAAEAARTATRQYAKRQLTWIRNQMTDWTVLPGPDPQAALEVIAAASHGPRT